MSGHTSARSRVVARGARFAVAGAIVVGVVVPATAAFAYPDPGTPTNPPADVGGTSTTNTPTSTSTSSLPFTGGDVAGMALIGAGAIGVGFVLVRQSRRQRALA